MTRASLYATVLGSSLMLGGCADLPVWGNLFSLAVTLAIFLGTVNLSRPSAHRS